MADLMAHILQVARLKAYALPKKNELSFRRTVEDPGLYSLRSAKNFQSVKAEELFSSGIHST